MCFHRVRRSLRGCRPKLSLGLSLFEEGFDLDFFGFLIALPFLDRWAYDPHEIMEKWGVYYYQAAIVFCWGRESKRVHMPWDYDHIKHEVRRPDGSWVPYVASYDVGPLRVVNDAGATMGGKEPDGRWEATYPYRYTLKDGTVQERTAKCHVERREWRQKWLKWCPWFALKRQSLDVEFNDEVGERTGSWKGGCIGCGWDMLPNESPEQTLRRMEAERKF